METGDLCFAPPSNSGALAPDGFRAVKRCEQVVIYGRVYCESGR